MFTLPNLSSFSSPEDAMSYADNVIELHGVHSAIGMAAAVLSNSAWAILRP